MPAIPRIDPLGAAALCLLLGAVAIPAFARGANWHTSKLKPGSAGSVVASAAPGVPISAPSLAPEPTALDAVPVAERADTSTGASGRLRIHLLEPGGAPSGVYEVPGGVGGHPFAFIGVIPFDAKRGASIGAYHVGYWPAELHAVHSEAYDNPTGFVEVTAENADMPVSDHFKLGDFVTHDGAPFPKYIVLREALLDKLELVLSDLEMHGVSTQHVEVLSGFRSPSYNFALGDASGRARESRHQYGDAVDMIVDTDGDGRMGDLNHDGRVDEGDVRVIEAAVDRVEHSHPELAGGLGLYREMGPSGPFAHIDVRGTRARWGTAGRLIYASGLPLGVSYTAVSSVETSHCQAEGASAVLCQGFRHTH
ncbi:MAG TPA: hypothetical protein VII66_07545 [Gemmatimonadaceae bacterium]